MNLIIAAIIVLAYFIPCVISAVEWRKPAKPKNIKHIVGNYLRGNCPKCSCTISNCDGKELGGISFCPCCGKKIQFPKNQPLIDGVKSLTIDEYMEGKRK